MAKQHLQFSNLDHQVGAQAFDYTHLSFDRGVALVRAALHGSPFRIEVSHVS